MPYFKDRAGQLWEFDNPDEATRKGMVEATDADINAHNASVDAEEKQKAYDAKPLGERVGDTLTAGAQALARQAMAPGMALTESLTGERPGQVPQEQLPADQQSALSESVFGDEARARRERHPLAATIGGGLAMAPAAALAGAGVAALAPGAGAILGSTVPAMLTEGAITAAPQEYDDAWFEQRPFELSRVAANTLMFSGVDFAFRGALKGIGMGIGKLAKKPASAIGSRNVVSEAQGAARELGVEPAGSGSVGAASAADLAEPFDDAIRQMSDRDAAVLARDAEPHFHLIAQDASESMTRLNNGLSDNLGNQLKYEDFAQYAEAFDPKTLERQAGWLSSVSEEADAAARRINALAEGDKTALDFGNLGKKATQTIDDFNRRIADAADPGQRIVLVDSYKKALDRLTMSIDASNSIDTVTRNELKSLIAPTRETLRKGLENTRYFGGAAELQRALNPNWHGLLEHWSKVQKILTEETGHIKFDTAGAGRITRESTVERMLAQLSKDPRSNQEFGKHLAGALENLQGLIDARQAKGISRLDGLDEMGADIRNLMEDWNLASTIGVAKNRTEALAKDPRKWATLAANVGERLPIVGKPIQVMRTLGDALADLHIQKGTPLARVWDSAYKRFATNPAFQDPSIIRNYPDWIAEALQNRGGKFTPPTGSASAPPGPLMPPAKTSGGPDLDAAFADFPRKQRVSLADVRARMSGMTREEQDQALLQMQRDKKLVLYQNDNPRSLSKADKDAAMDLNGSPRHMVYFETPAINRALERSKQRGVANFDALTAILGSRGAVKNKITPREARAILAPRAADVVDPLGVGGKIEGVIPRSQAADPLNREAVAANFQPIPEHDVFTDHVGSIALDGRLAERWTGQGGKTPGGVFKGSDGVLRYVKADKDSAHTVVEGGNDAMYRALGVKTLNTSTGKLPDGTAVLYSDYRPDWLDLAQIPDWSVLPPSVSESYAKQVPADIIMGNWDVSRNARNVKTDGVSTIMADAGEAGSNAWSASKWYKGDDKHLRTELARLGTSARGEVPRSLEEATVNPLWGPIVGEQPPHALLAPLAGDEGRIRELMQASYDHAVGVINGAGGPEAFIAKHQPTLSQSEVKRAASEMQRRIAYLGPAIGALSAMLAVAFSSDDASAADHPASSVAPTPDSAYRDALREINQAGDNHIKAMASSALKLKPPRGKDRDPLSLFAGKRSIQDAVEDSRARLDEIMGDPTTLLEQLGASTGELGKTHKSVYMAVSGKVSEVAAYLQSVMPQRTATTLTDQRGAAVSFDRAWDYAARYVGATQPRAALREVVRGSAPPEMLEAVQQAWPELWQSFQVEMLGQVQRMVAAGKHIPSEKLRRLDSLLGLRGQLDPSATLDVAQHFLAAQDAEAQKRQQAGGKAPGGAPSGGVARAALQTRLGAISSERTTQ